MKIARQLTELISACEFYKKYIPKYLSRLLFEQIEVAFSIQRLPLQNI